MVCLLFLSVAATPDALLCVRPSHLLFLPAGTLPSPLLGAEVGDDGGAKFYFHCPQLGYHLLREAFLKLKFCHLRWVPPSALTHAP